MASVYKRTYQNAAGKRVACEKYTVECKIGGRYVKLAAYADKRASEETGRKVERLANLREAGEQPDAALTRWLEGLSGKLRDKLAGFGLLDGTAVASTKLLRDHLDDYRQALLDKGGTEKHANQTRTRIRAILDGTGARHLSDLSAAAVSRYLAERRTLDRAKGGLSVASSNHWLRAIKSFCTWLVKERRASDNPLAHLSIMNTDADRRRERRAMDADELRWLLDVTRRGPERFGMSGAARAMVYRLAVESGLRANEIRHLTRASFELDGTEPTVTVEAAYSKRRRQDTLPLRTDTAASLREFLGHKLPTARAFNLRTSDKTADMMRTDLEAARGQWLDDAKTAAERMRRAASSFLADRDDADRVADFHSLRHTFITNLARGGVHPKEAQALARHSTITLTMDRYSHVTRRTLGKALDALPDLSPAGRDAGRATGTDASPVDAVSTGGPTGGKAARLGAPTFANMRNNGTECTVPQHEENPGNSGVFSRTGVNQNDWAQSDSNGRHADYESAA